MKNILVPTDFSDCAHHAAEVAIQLARKSDAMLHFIHLLDVPIDWLYPGADMDKRYPDVDQRVRKARHQLEALVKEAEQQGTKAKADIEYNQDYSVVITYIAQHTIELVVMGSHGVSGIRELFIGSTTQKVVRLSPIPVLVIKQRSENLSIGQIVFAYDFEIPAHTVFLKIADFAALLHAKMHLLYINTPLNFKESPEINNKLDEYASLAPQVVASVNVFNSLNFEKGLVAFCKEKEGDMIVMLTHARKGLSRLLNSSVTERVINHVDIPVLSLTIGHNEP